MERLEKFKQRPLSWSSINSYNYSPKDWYEHYIEDVKFHATKKMLFGNIIGQKLSSDPTFLPEVKRYNIFEKELTALIELEDKKIKLIGYLDSMDMDTKAFYEYKTSSSTTRWTQETAEATGQILFYMLLLWINYGIRPEDISCHLFYIPVRQKENFDMELSGEEVQCFEVKHTSEEVIKFGKYIEKMHDRMIKYIEKKLSPVTPCSKK